MLASIDRRTLLIGGGLGIGLVVWFVAWPRHLASDLATRKGEQAFGAFLKVGRDGRVTVAVPQVETGQGVWTALPQIVADELGAAWETVAVEPAPLAPGYANPLIGDQPMRMTAGSTSIRAFEMPLRRAGATAREMLIAAAAERWDVSARECEAADGFVLHKDRTFSFAELAEEAAHRHPPSNPMLRTSAKARLTGQPLPRLDLPAKSDGSFRFAADVRLPDMLFASARVAPPGGRLTGFSRQKAAKFIVRNQWLAVIAENWWAAEQILHAANPHFSAPESPSRDAILIMHQQLLDSGDAESFFSRGDYDSAVEDSRPLAAIYWVAPAQHLGLEPLTATARFSGDHLEVWAPTQAPDFARAAAVAAAGKFAANVTLYPMPVGDSGGRSLEADAIPIAVELARKLKRPVQLSLSPSVSQNHDRVAPAALATMTALPGAGGITAAWKMRVVTSDGFGSAIRRLAGGDASDKLGKTALDAAIPPYAIPDVSIDAVSAKSLFPTGYMRGHPQCAMTFFTESFIDEMAHAAGLEPLAFRTTLLGGNPRLARCIQAAASNGGWDGGARGSTLGLAACSAFGSHIGLLANATIGADQTVEVHRLVAAVDCGRIVNPQLVHQQIEGGLIWALGLANVREPDWAAGMPRSRPLGAIGLPRIARMPEIRVDLIPSNAPPGGVSGLGVAVLAPAVANAIYAATGKRLRSLPFDPMAAA
ncbi:MAG: molybdopterin cofactor-binding domain-containing protein [Sphingomicrobium sp.]